MICMILIHFELIFVYGVRRFKCILLHVYVLFFFFVSALFVVLSPLNCLNTFVDHKCRFVLISIPLIYLSINYASSPTLFNYVALEKVLKLELVSPLTLLFFSRIALAILNADHFL